MLTQAQSDAGVRDAAIAGRWHRLDNPVAWLNIQRRRREIEQGHTRRIDDYLSRPEAQNRKRGRDPREALPESDDLQAVADTFGAGARRLRQALALDLHGLKAKAKRILFCGRIGKRQNCQTDRNHRFFRAYRCQGRYCETCGPAWFRKKFSDLLFALEPIVDRLLRDGKKRGRLMVVAKLDFTTRNTGEMPGPGFVREFHRARHEFWRLAEKFCGIAPAVSATKRARRREIRELLRPGSDVSAQEKFELKAELSRLVRDCAVYGWAGCDEFGGSNSNLHSHCLYVGPILPQSKKHKELSALWSLSCVRDRQRRRELLRFVRKHGLRGLWAELRQEEKRHVSIKRARSFQAALAHALKYSSKFVSLSEPERLADLEAAFHKTRRFSTGGAFYRLKVMREPGEDSELGCCPLCGSPLAEVVEGWVPRFVLEAEGRRDVDEARQQVGKQKVFGGASPP